MSRNVYTCKHEICTQHNLLVNSCDSHSCNHYCTLWFYESLLLLGLLFCGYMLSFVCCTITCYFENACVCLLVVVVVFYVFCMLWVVTSSFVKLYFLRLSSHCLMTKSELALTQTDTHTHTYTLGRFFVRRTRSLSASLCSLILVGRLLVLVIFFLLSKMEHSYASSDLICFALVWHHPSALFVFAVLAPFSSFLFVNHIAKHTLLKYNHLFFS